MDLLIEEVKTLGVIGVVGYTGQKVQRVIMIKSSAEKVSKDQLIEHKEIFEELAISYAVENQRNTGSCIRNCVNTYTDITFTI